MGSVQGILIGFLLVILLGMLLAKLFKPKWF